MIEINLPKIKVTGHYQIQIIRANGDVDTVADFDNLITDACLNYMASSALSSINHIGVGSSQTAPQFSDTVLGAQIGSRASNSNSFDSSFNAAGNFWESSKTWTFGLGAIVGDIAEVGAFSAPTGGVMVSRSLLKDGLGNPITIPVQADEQLAVTWKFRVYPPLGDFTGSFVITTNGVPVNHSYIIRASDIDSPSSAWSIGMATFTSTSTFNAYENDVLGDVYSGPTAGGLGSGSGSASYDGYVAGSFERAMTLSLSSSQANFATGIGAILFNRYYKASFSPKIPKTNIRRLELRLMIRWGR